MKKKLLFAVLLLAATYTNSLGDSVRIVSPSGTGAPHSCDVRRYYPKNLIPACVQGTVEIKFRIGVNGVTKGFEISRSSGSRGLDDAT
jgi:outer membrane biosynthesis protein TonB